MVEVFKTLHKICFLRRMRLTCPAHTVLAETCPNIHCICITMLTPMLLVSLLFILRCSTAIAVNLKPAPHVSAATSQLERPPVSLAFGVMVYQKPGQSFEDTYAAFDRLMRVIYSPLKHVYVVHVDVKSDARLIDRIHGYCPATAHNCLHVAPRNVAWAGLSTAEMMLALMQEAFEGDAGGAQLAWDYFLLAGHESVSLGTLEYMETYLAAFPSGTNFVHCMNISGYDFFGQWENVYGRLGDVVIETFMGPLIERTGIQRPVWDGVTFYKSIQLVVVSRSFVRYMIHGPDTRRLMLYLATVKTSDEMLVPTLLQLNPSFARTATCTSTLHFTHWIRPGGSWHPEYLTLEHLPKMLRANDFLFARKINANISASLLEALDKLRPVYFSAYVDSLNPFNATAVMDRPDSALTPMNAWLPQAARVYLRRLSEADNAAAASAVEGLERTSVPAEVRDAARQGLADLEARLSSPLYYSFLSSAAAAVEPPSQVAPLDGSISRLALDVLDRVRRVRDEVEISRFRRAWEDRQRYEASLRSQHSQQHRAKEDDAFTSSSSSAERTASGVKKPSRNERNIYWNRKRPKTEL